jgi:hypothetical protein
MNNKKANMSSVGPTILARSVVKGIVALVLAATVVLTLVSVCNPQDRDAYTLLQLRDTANLEFTPPGTNGIGSLHTTSSRLRRPMAAAPSNNNNNNKKKTGNNNNNNNDGEFVITFVGDTMFQNTGYNWETTHFGSSWDPADGFRYIRPLLNRTDYLIMNLEGPITELPITSKFVVVALRVCSPQSYDVLWRLTLFCFAKLLYISRCKASQYI